MTVYNFPFTFVEIFESIGNKDKVYLRKLVDEKHKEHTMYRNELLQYQAVINYTKRS